MTLNDTTTITGESTEIYDDIIFVNDADANDNLNVNAIVNDDYVNADVNVNEKLQKMPPNLKIVDKFLGEYNDDNDNNNNVLIPPQYQYQQLLNNAYLVLQQQTFPDTITTTASAMNYFPNMMVAETPSRPLIQNNYLLTQECILSPSIAQKVPVTTPLISPTTIVSPATTATMYTATSSDLSEASSSSSSLTPVSPSPSSSSPSSSRTRTRTRTRTTRSSSTSSISTSETTTTITPPSPYQYPNHNCDDLSYLPKVTNPTDDEKRRRNTLASAKFRNKRRMKEQELERIAREMTEKAELLECRVKELESEVKLLRGLIIDIDSSRLNGSSHNDRPINIGSSNDSISRNNQLSRNTMISDDYIDDNNSDGVGNSRVATTTTNTF